MTRTPPPVVFVYGALRSGTTLFRLMLNAHPEVNNPGEADFLFDFLVPDAAASGGWRYDIEAMRRHRIFLARDIAIKGGLDGLALLDDLLAQLQAKAGGMLSLNIHRHAGRIAAVLPEARFVHLLRDPRDVARSSIGMGWTGTSYFGVDHWIDTEQDWDRAGIASGRVLEMQFETLMGSIETELRRVCDFLGVAFSPAMLDYHLNTSYGPPDPGIARQWQKRATAREIALIEGKCGALLRQRGYEPNGRGTVPGPVERLWLTSADRLLRWRFNVRRLGLLLFLSAQVARHFGLGRLGDWTQQRIDAKMVRLLK